MSYRGFAPGANALHRLTIYTSILGKLARATGLRDFLQRPKETSGFGLPVKQCRPTDGVFICVVIQRHRGLEQAHGRSSR